MWWLSAFKEDLLTGIRAVLTHKTFTSILRNSFKRAFSTTNYPLFNAQTALERRTPDLKLRCAGVSRLYAFPVENKGSNT